MRPAVTIVFLNIVSKRQSVRINHCNMSIVWTVFVMLADEPAAACTLLSRFVFLGSIYNEQGLELACSFSLGTYASNALQAQLLVCDHPR